MFARIIVIVALMTLAVAWGARTSDGAGERVYVVQGGDTLWTIAAKHYGGDPREGVWELQDRNHLRGTLIRPGQRLVLP